MAVQPRVPSHSRPPERVNSFVPKMGTTARPRLNLCFSCALTVFVLSVAAFAVWLYAFPAGYAGAVAGLNPRAVTQFQAHFPFRLWTSLSASHWSLGFLVLLLILWAAYALAVVAALRGAAPKPRVVLRTIITAAITMAVFCPPLLTTDGYSYLGYSHLHVLYGLNPYVTTTAPLYTHNDPVTHFLFWQIPTVYGPIWTALTDAIVCLLPHSLWGQIVAIKLVEAAALVAAAGAGRRIADQFRPGWGNLTLLAIGLNPLLLIEGPGSGHNDPLMIALALCSVALILEKRWAGAGLLLGLSIGVKLVTLALLPWLLIECIRRSSGRARLTTSLTLAGSALLPLVIGYAAFWNGPDTLLALQQRSLHGFDPAAQAQTARIGAWLAAHGASAQAIPILTVLYQRRVLFAAYALLSAWLWRNRAQGGWLTAWTVFAPIVMFTGMGDPFPWYIAWFWPFALLRWNKLSLGLSAASFLLALVWESFYTFLRPV